MVFAPLAQSFSRPHIPLPVSTNSMNRLQVTPPYTLDGSHMEAVNNSARLLKLLVSKHKFFKIDDLFD
jgi:hypothetical protein